MHCHFSRKHLIATCKERTLGLHLEVMGIKISVWDHSFITFAKFSEKLTFLKNFFRKILRT